MKQKKFLIKKNLPVILLLAFIAGLNSNVTGQEITTYQYRYVPPDKTAEFIKRETTYWSQVARKAIDKGSSLTFWALLEKVGGSNLQNSPNYLFINTYKDVDGNLGEVWNAAAVFPKIPMASISTDAISKVTDQFFLRDANWEQSAKAVPEKDFKWVILVYHNSVSPGNFVALEKRHWAPFIKSAMDNNQTEQVAWGNAIVLTPSGPDVKFNSVSFDMFPTLKAALVQDWKPDVKFPEVGLDSLQKIAPKEPGRELYRIVKVEAKK